MNTYYFTCFELTTKRKRLFGKTERLATSPAVVSVHAEGYREAVEKALKISQRNLCVLEVVSEDLSDKEQTK